MGRRLEAWNHFGALPNTVTLLTWIRRTDDIKAAQGVAITYHLLLLTKSSTHLASYLAEKGC